MERKHLLPYHILYQDESDEMETSHRKPTGFPNHQEQEEMERDDDQLDVYLPHRNIVDKDSIPQIESVLLY